MSDLVSYKSSDKHAIVTLNNGKVNALSSDVIAALNESLDRAEKDKLVVILTGKPGMFSGGYDLKEMSLGIDAAMALVTKGSTLARRMLAFPTPIITACSGHAIAKGAFLLLSSDYSIGVKGDFKIGLNEVAIGMTMHYAGIEIARYRLSPIHFQRAVNNAELYNPQNSVDAGFLDTLTDADSLMDEALKKASELAELNLTAHAATKIKMREGQLSALDKAIEVDAGGSMYG